MQCFNDISSKYSVGNTVYLIYINTYECLPSYLYREKECKYSQ